MDLLSSRRSPQMQPGGYKNTLHPGTCKRKSPDAEASGLKREKKRKVTSHAWHGFRARRNRGLFRGLAAARLRRLGRHKRFRTAHRHRQVLAFARERQVVLLLA